MEEIFYVKDATLYAVTVALEPSFSVTAERKLFYSLGLGLSYSSFFEYDVSPDADRFVLAEPMGRDQPTKIQIVQNWFAEFEGRE
jgi:hypothetical protein